MTATPWDTPVPEADPFAQNEKAPSLKFPTVGTTYSGTVTDTPRLVQQRDYETGNPATWPDGNPKMAVVVNLEVNGEPASLWAPKPSSMFRALADAQKQAAARIQPGGRLSVRFDREEPNQKNPRLNPMKVYAAKYEPNDPFSDGADANGTTAQPASQAAPPF